MSATHSGVIVLADMFTEGTDGQFVALTFVDAATDAPIDTDTITEVRATLRSLDTDVRLFEDADVTPGAGSRGSYSAEDELVITFTADDLAASGSREIQRRLLTLTVTHAPGQLFQGAVQFDLRNLGDVVTPAVLHHRRLTVPTSPTPSQPASPTPPERPTHPDLDPGRPGRPDIGRPGRPDFEPAHPERPVETDPDTEPGESDDDA